MRRAQIREAARFRVSVCYLDPSMSTRGTSAPNGKPSSRHQSTTARWAAASCAVLALVLVVSLATGSEKPAREPLTDGSSCVTASASQIRDWVDSHKNEIPYGLRASEVAAQVQKLCDGGSSAILAPSLLASAANAAVEARRTETSPSPAEQQPTK
jgi:hypothetical protein